MQARSLLLGACLSFFALSGGRVSAAEGIGSVIDNGLLNEIG